MNRRTFGGLVAGAILAACQGGAAQESRTWSTRGVIREIRRQRRSLTIRHEDIPGLMPAMTMPFDVARDELFEGLEVGQTIRFRFRRTEDARYVIEAITR